MIPILILVAISAYLLGYITRILIEKGPKFTIKNPYQEIGFSIEEIDGKSNQSNYGEPIIIRDEIRSAPKLDTIFNPNRRVENKDQPCE
jgi:hypothetical protein